MKKQFFWINAHHITPIKSIYLVILIFNLFFFKFSLFKSQIMHKNLPYFKIDQIKDSLMFFFISLNFIANVLAAFLVARVAILLYSVKFYFIVLFLGY